MFKQVIILLVVALIVVINFETSFAETIKVSIPKGTGKPGCEIKELCYIPDPITVKTGSFVEWKNYDSVAHTVTSGTPNTGPDGIIYSDLISEGETFVFRFHKPGSYPYYCMLHPWMQGLVIVEDLPAKSIQDFDIAEVQISADGSTVIEIKTNKPKAGEKLPLEIRFFDMNDNLLIHMNYDVRVIQDNEDVLFVENAHSNDGTSEFQTRILESDNPVDVKIGIRGIYLPSESSQPVKEILEFHKIPEFGIVSILLIFGLSSIILIPKIFLKPY